VTSESGQAWRTSVRSPKKQEKRKQLVAILSGMLVLLVFLVISLLRHPALPRLLFVSVASPVPTKLDPKNLPDLTSQENGRLIKSQFESLAKTNSDRVIQVSELVSLTKLPLELPKCVGEYLVLYLDARVVTRKNNEIEGEVSVMLSLDGEAAVSLTEILDLVKERRPEYALLLLDLDPTPPGFSSGALAADVFPAIRNQIQNSKIPGLSAICACKSGERSWEFPEEPVEPSSKEEPSSTESADEASAVATPLHTYRNTAFAHFFAEAMRNGEAETIRDLYEYLKEHVGKSAKDHFEVTQTVWVYPPLSGEAGDGTLLLKGFDFRGFNRQVSFPSDVKAIVQGDEKVGEKRGGTSEETTTEQNNSDSNKAKPPARTPGKNIRDFEDQLSKIAEADGTVTLLDTWRDTQRLIAYAKYDLRFPHSSIKKEGLLDSSITYNVRALRDGLKNRTTADARIIKSLAVTDLKKPEKLPEIDAQNENVELPESLTSDSEEERNVALREQSAWLVKVIEDKLKPGGDRLTSDSLKEIQKQITILNGFFLNLDGKEMPDSLMVLHRLMQNFDQVAVNNSPELKQFISTVIKLVHARQKLLQLTIDSNGDSVPISKEFFESCKPKLKEALSHLNAAEKWLSSQVAGVDGGQQAVECLKNANKSMEVITNDQAERRQKTRLTIELRNQLPLLIEFLAIRMERQGLTVAEIDGLGKSVASLASDTGIEHIYIFDSQWDDQFFSPELQKTFYEITRNFRPSPLDSQQDRSHFNDIRKSIKQLVERDTPEDRFLVLHLPREYQTGVGTSLRPPSSAKIVPPKNRLRFTGVWTAFWSIRTLQSLTSLSDPYYRTDSNKQNDNMELVTQWQQLVRALAEEHSGGSEADGSSTKGARTGKGYGTLWARAQLSESLNRRWNEYYRTQTAAASSEINLVDSREVLELQEPPVGVAALNGAPISSTSSPFQLKLEKPKGGSRVYLKDPMQGAGLRINNNSAVSVSGWYFADLPESDPEVLFQVDVPGGISRELLLLAVFVNSDHAPVGVYRSSVAPTNEPDWEIEIARVPPDSPKISVDEDDFSAPNPNIKLRRFDLIPSTIGDESKDKPVELMVRIRNVGGIPTQTKVRMYVLDSPQIESSDVRRILQNKPQCEWPPIKFTDSLVVENLPFNPASVASTPGAQPVPPPAPADPLNVNFGLLFHIATEETDGVTPSKEKFIKLFPHLIDPKKLLTEASARFDRKKNSLTVRLRLDTNSRDTQIQGRKVPYLITFNEKLRQCKPDEFIQGILTTDDPIKEIKIEFEKSSLLVDLLKSPHRDNILEFGVSLVDPMNKGVPHVFRWRFDNATPQRLDEIVKNEIPEVRIEFEPDVPKENPRFVDPATGNMILGAKWEEARLPVAFHFHGGKFSAKHQWELIANIIRGGADLSQKSGQRILTERVNSPYRQTVKVAGGTEGEWKFSTETKLYPNDELNINPAKVFKFMQDNESSCGTYILEATLRESDGTGVAAEEQIVSFIVDHTKPKIDKLDDEEQGTKDSVMYDEKELKVRFVATDEDSGINQIKVWLGGDGDADSEDPVATRYLPDKDGQFNYSISSKYFPKVEEKVGEKNFVEKTLHIEVMNNAGLVNTDSKRIQFIRPAAPKPADKVEPMDEFGHIKVTMPMKYSSPWVVTVKGPTGGPKEQEGSKKEFEFRDLPVGQYTVEWKVKGNGLHDGFRRVTVTKDDEKTVTAE
jgi:hypothetical protein